MQTKVCRINGMMLEVPSEYLAMVHHCQTEAGAIPVFYVEHAHFEWSVARLSAGETALDVGASVGLFAAGFSAKVGPAGHVYAFEPARRANHMLQTVAARNELRNLTIESMAIADNVGSATFHELPGDDRCTWRAECSALQVAEQIPGTASYEVPITTIDTYLESRSERGRSRVGVIKIDIEGFEAHALRGGMQTIRGHKPALCIDIHARLDGPGNTEPEVQELLAPLGYSFERRGHVLLCTPA